MNALTHASKQLFDRPDDDCYGSIDLMEKFLIGRESATRELKVKSMSVFPSENGETTVKIGAETDQGIVQGYLNDWSFGNLCSLVPAPKRYINELPAELASDCLNHGLKTRFENNNGTVMNYTGGLSRAFYSERYSRVSDLEVVQAVKESAVPVGYLPAGFFAGKRGGLAPVRPEASGLYASDRDIFIFMAHEQEPFEVNGDAYCHCFCLWNSEVTSKTLGFLTCLYRYICGNHMIWGARDVIERKARHVGDPRQILNEFQMVIEGYEKYRNQIRDENYAKICAAQALPFADTRERVAKRLEEYMAKKEASSVLPFLDDSRAYPKSKLSAFGVAQAVTLYSQTAVFAEDRMKFDRIGGQIIRDVVGF